MFQIYINISSTCMSMQLRVNYGSKRRDYCLFFLCLPPMRGVVFVTGSMSPTIVPKSTIANSKLTPGDEVNISYFQITMMAIRCPCDLAVLMLFVLSNWQTSCQGLWGESYFYSMVVERFRRQNGSPRLANHCSAGYGGNLWKLALSADRALGAQSIKYVKPRR